MSENFLSEADRDCERIQKLIIAEVRMRREIVLHTSNRMFIYELIRLLLLLDLITLICSIVSEPSYEMIWTTAAINCIFFAFGYPIAVKDDHTLVIVDEAGVCIESISTGRLRVDVRIFAGIVIMPEYMYDETGHLELVFKHDKPAYFMLWVDAIDDEMYTFDKHSHAFFRKYKKNIICQSVYNKEAVDLLLTLNPDIKLIFLNNFR